MALFFSILVSEIFFPSFQVPNAVIWGCILAREDARRHVIWANINFNILFIYQCYFFFHLNVRNIFGRLSNVYIIILSILIFIMIVIFVCGV